MVTVLEIPALGKVRRYETSLEEIIDRYDYNTIWSIEDNCKSGVIINHLMETVEIFVEKRGDLSELLSKEL